ncbi:MAG: serine hydrolase [Clostridia bacterium]|nr:serine hydrolase [Clostridia bacterium]MBQ7120695.1 serine hydrolase [Clostridia bacterium]
MKRFLSIFFTAVLLLSAVFCVPAVASYDEVMESMKLHSDCVLLVSADNSEVIFAKNEGKQTSPASLTKVITAMVVLENCENLNQLVTVSESAIKELDGTGSSLGGLQAGEQVSVYDLLCNLLMQSANEAATTLADFISGNDRDKFISMMNEVAERLGCKNSHFVNPHGLDDDDQYVTAEDMAKFVAHAMTFPVFEEIFGRVTYTLNATNLQEERIIRNTNNMMNSAYKDYYCKYVKGGKTGSTSIAGRCVVAVASNDGYNYIGVALNSTMSDVDGDGVNENGAFLDCKEMFDWAFKNIELVAISDTTKIVGQVPVKYAKTTDYLTLSPAETVYSLVPVGTDSGSLLVEPVEDTLPEFVKAPIKKGEKICKAKVLYAGRVIKEIDLVASMDVEMGIFSFLGTLAKNLASSWPFRIVAILVIAALIILLFMRRKKNRAKAAEKSNYRVLNYNDFMRLR